MRGLAAVGKIKKQMDQQNEAFMASLTPQFSLKDKESAIILFNGDPDQEPLIVEEHTYKNGSSFGSHMCAKTADKHEGCVACYLHARGDKRISRPTPKAVFNVVDTRMFHKAKNDEKSKKSGKDRFDYIPCKADSAPCKYCKMKVDVTPGGQKRYIATMRWAAAISDLNDDLKKRCKCGGKTKITGYYHQETGEEVDDFDNDVADQYKAKYVCSLCKSCKPRSIFDTPIKISRSGANMDTTYSFSKADEDFERQGWMDDVKLIDLDAACTPRSADQMAKQLGVMNPFRAGGSDKTTEVEEYEEAAESDLFGGK